MAQPAPADITAPRLQLFAPRCDYLALAPHLDAAAKAHGIATPRQVRHFMAQVYVESEGLTRLEENLNYTAARLLEVWPSRFDARSATHCAGQPERIACIAYGGRMGNTAAQDGWTYRGRGLLQITGRAAYTAAEQRLGQPFVAQPNLVAEAAGAAATAGDYWRMRGFNLVLAEYSIDTEACARIRRLINGAEMGLQQAQQHLARAATIWRG